MGGKDRILLALEVVCGVLPITIVGGTYALLGLLFGTVSMVMAVRELAFGGFAFWLGVFALAAGGVVGIIGLWTVIAMSAASQPPRPPMAALAIRGSVIGVLTAGVLLVLVIARSVAIRPLVVYMIVAPVVVVVHRAPAIVRRARQGPIISSLE